MTTLAQRRDIADSQESPLVRLLAPFALLHAAMFVYDLQNPERFFYADRAGDRIVSLDRLVHAWQSSGDVAGVLASRGILGDWLPQGLLYLAGGMTLVVAVQVLLALVSIACVRRIGLRLGLGETAAFAAAALYGLLPHTLVYPHELASEGLFVPLVVIAFAALGAAASGLAIGAAIVIRPVVGLWPLIEGFFFDSGRKYFAVAMLPLAAWMAFIHYQTGELSIGRSHADLGSNLYQRAVRMTAHLPPHQRVEGAGRMSAIDYLRFSLRHPREAAAHHARDVATLFSKSGIERVVLDYLDLFPEKRSQLQQSGSGWRKQLETRGVIAALQSLLAGNALLTLISLAGAALFTALMLLAVRGAFAPAADRRLRLMLAAFVVYIFVTAQAVDAAASRHRAPAEFAICLLALLALRKPRHAA